MKKPFYLQKTFWAGLGLITAGGWNIYKGNVSEGIQSIFTGFGIIFVRDAINNTAK
jgi:hypothetical protein